MKLLWIIFTNIIFVPQIDGQIYPVSRRLNYGDTFMGKRKEVPIRKSYPESGDVINPRWLVVGGRKVVPGTVYRVIFQALKSHLTPPGQTMTVRASLIHDFHQVSFTKEKITFGETTHLLLRVPDSSVDGKWYLAVEGSEGTGELPLFKNTTQLQFDPKFLTILIQTSRPVYNAGQMIRFRVIMLTRSLKPYDEPIDVFVIDPKGHVMRRWPSRQTGDGVVALNFQLPHYPLTGQWTIRVRARGQTEEKAVEVEHYFNPRFEVFVRLPHSVKVTSETLDGVVVANMTNWRNVYGNLTLRMEYATHLRGEIPQKFQIVYQEFIKDFKGVYDFQLSLEDVPVNNLIDTTEVVRQDLTLRVHATVGEAFGWEVQEGWAMARIVEDTAKISFLGDQPLIFKPGMPISLHLLVSYDDDHPMSEDILSDGRVTVTLTTSGSTTKEEEVTVYGRSLAEDKGIVNVKFSVPDGSTSFKADASFTSLEHGLSAGASIIGIPQHSPRDYYLQVDTSTIQAVPGENIVLHVRHNFFVDYVNYVIVNKGVILYNAREVVKAMNVPSVKTFAIPASTEMTPFVHIVVWGITQEGQLVADSIGIPVNPLGQHEVDVRWNEDKDHTGGSVEMKLIGEVGAVFGVSAIWEETHYMDSGHDLSFERVLHHMLTLDQEEIFDDYYNFSTAIPNIRRAATRSRDGEEGTVEVFPTTFTGPDSPSTFDFSQLVLVTDASTYYHPSLSTEKPRCNEGELPCLTGGCYQVGERCDGEHQCSDRSDEAGCPVNVDPLRKFRLNRVSRLERFFDISDGDWAWQDQRRFGAEIMVFPIPKRPQTWVVSIFAVGKTLGLGLLTEKIKFDSAGPFMLTLEGPKVARMWEQVGLTGSIFNFHESMVGVMVTLPGSPDYKSVLVEEKGIVDNYKPRTVHGDRQHIIWLEPGENKDVHFPIVFTRMGDIEVTLKGSTQMQADSHTITISVQPEGVQIGKHTSLLIDMKNRALVYKFLDIHLDETPVVPYSIDRKYIFSTPSGHVSITGDVVGPAFPDILDDASEECLLGTELMGAETAAFNFGTYIWSLHYLRLTNQLSHDMLYTILAAANVQYASLARYQEENGAFRMWLESEQSVWLTAYILRTMWIAVFQDWENHIYIDPHIISKGAQWILQYQGVNGAFRETDEYIHPLDPKLDSDFDKKYSRVGYRNVSLTAQVLLTLTDIAPNLDANLHTQVQQAKTRAIRFLERELMDISDPYELALVAWALTKADSEYKTAAFAKLDQNKRQHGNIIYWSREPVAFNPIIHEDSQKPFILPKDDNKWDAHSVETTAYALLVYVAREGIGIVQENIVRFLTSMRELDKGLISTLDSVEALHALVEYSHRARLRDVTDMTITIEHSANRNMTIDVHLGQTLDLAKMKVFDLENIYGHLTVVGRGSGQAIVQLDYSYGVDVISEIDYPPYPAFDFSITSKYYGRNNSHIIMNACSRWTNTEERQASGLAVIEVHLPSGYYIMQDKLIELVNSRRVKNLRWALVTDTQVKFFFNHLDNDETCLQYQLERWYPVANHSRYNMAQVYELYQPERFNMTMFEVYPLYGLDICEVCGSFQCPYCPFYSRSIKVDSIPFIFLSLLVLLNLMLM